MEAPTGLHGGGQQFKATQQWKELLRHMLTQSAWTRRAGRSQPDSRASLRCNGKSLRSAIADFLAKNWESLPRQPDGDAALRLCQQLLDSGAILADSGHRFEPKATRWYTLNSTSPCVLPFLDFITQLAPGNQPGNEAQEPEASLKKTPIACRLQRGFGRVLESNHRRVRDQLARMSCRSHHARSWSCLPPPADESDERRQSSDCRDRPVSAVQKSMRNDFYSCHDSRSPSLDFYIHQLCLQRLLKLVDLPIIDELVHTEKLTHSAPVGCDFLNLDDSFSESAPPWRQAARSQQQQQQQQPMRRELSAVFLANQVARGLSFRSLAAGEGVGEHRSLADAEQLLLKLPLLLARSPDPLGWRRLAHVFQALLGHQVTRSRAQANAKILQLSFCLLSLQHRQLSENLLSFVRCCCCHGNARRPRAAAALLPQLAEILVPETAAPPSLSPSACRQRVHRLFLEMLDRCDQLFRVPSDIFHTARLLKLRRCQPELLTNSVYCSQLSREEHRRVTKEVTEKAVKELMETLLDDPKVSLKDKQAKLRLLRLHHREIYDKHFASVKF